MDALLKTPMGLGNHTAGYVTMHLVQCPLFNMVIRSGPERLQREFIHTKHFLVSNLGQIFKYIFTMTFIY